MIRHMIKPGTVFFFHDSQNSFVYAGVLMVVTKAFSRREWKFRQLTGNNDFETVFLQHDNPKISIVGQLPPDDLDTKIWKEEYRISSFPRVASKTNRIISFFKKYW